MSLKTFSDTWCLCIKYFKRWIRENIGKMLRRCVLINLSARRLHYPAQPSAEIREMVLPVCVCSGSDQRKHQSSASLGFVRWIHRLPVTPHKGRMTRKMFPYDDAIIFDGKITYVGCDGDSIFWETAYVDINNVINQSSDPKLIFNSEYEFMRIQVLEFNFVSNNYANDLYELSVHQGNFLYVIQYISFHSTVRDICLWVYFQNKNVLKHLL